MSTPATIQTGDEAQFYAAELVSGRDLVWRCDHRHRTREAAEKCANEAWAKEEERA